MSIKLPQYTIQTTTKQRSKYSKLIVPLLLISCFFFGYIAKGYLTQSNLKSLQMRNEVLEEINSKNQDEIVQNSSELSHLKTEKKVKQEAILLLQKDYKESIDIQNSLKSDISFYQRLLSPDAENKGLRVFETQLALKSEQEYKLIVVLVQKIERAIEIKGEVRIDLKGKLKGNDETFQLNKEKLNYQFKYFENITLDISLPEGFIAEQLVVKLIPNNKKSKTVTQTVDWNSLTN